MAAVFLEGDDIVIDQRTCEKKDEADELDIRVCAPAFAVVIRGGVEDDEHDGPHTNSSAGIDECPMDGCKDFGDLIDNRR